MTPATYSLILMELLLYRSNDTLLMLYRQSLNLSNKSGDFPLYLLAVRAVNSNYTAGE